MQSKIRRNLCLFLALSGSIAPALFIGCTRTTPVEEGPAPLPYQDQIVKVAVPNEWLAILLNRYKPSWMKKTGARVEAVAYTGTPDATANDTSAWIIRPAEMPRWASSGRLLPVPAEYKAPAGAYNWVGLLALYREKLLRWAGEAYALPLLGESPLCFYRADLLADAGHQQAFRDQYQRDLQPPHTWDDFADIAEYFFSRKEPAKAGPSLPALPESAEELDYLFYSVAAPHVRRAVFQGQNRPVSDEELFSFHYNLKTGEPRIEHAGFVHALQLLQRLQRFRPAGFSAAPPQAFADGQAVLCLADASWISRFRKGLAPTSLGVCEVPGSARWFRFRDCKEQAAPNGNPIPYQGAGGWIAVVPRSAPHPEAAFALFAELGGRATSVQIVFEPQWGGGTFREAHLQPDKNWYSFELDQEKTVRLREAIRHTLDRAGLKNPAVSLRIPDQQAYRQALVEQVRNALTANAGAKEALHKVTVRWKELDAAKDEKKRKNDYLLSLGLSPVQ
jgi:multiple sugar transport system substrate-binding protein